MQCADGMYVVRLHLRMQGEMQALFLRHEGFLGAVGAFLSVHPMAGVAVSAAVSSSREPGKVRKNRNRNSKQLVIKQSLVAHETPSSHGHHTSH